MHAFDSAGNLTLSLFFPYLSPSPSHISWAVPSLSLSLSLSPMLSLKWAQPGLGLLCRRGSMDEERGARRARAVMLRRRRRRHALSCVDGCCVCCAAERIRDPQLGGWHTHEPRHSL